MALRPGEWVRVLAGTIGVLHGPEDVLEPRVRVLDGRAMSWIGRLRSWTAARRAGDSSGARAERRSSGPAEHLPLGDVKPLVENVSQSQREDGLGLAPFVLQVVDERVGSSLDDGVDLLLAVGVAVPLL